MIMLKSICPRAIYNKFRASAAIGRYLLVSASNVMVSGDLRLSQPFTSALMALYMGKFPIADAAQSKVWICRRCKARNKAGSDTCRKCGYHALRPKRKNTRVKK